MPSGQPSFICVNCNKSFSCNSASYHYKTKLCDDCLCVFTRKNGTRLKKITNHCTNCKKTDVELFSANTRHKFCSEECKVQFKIRSKRNYYDVNYWIDKHGYDEESAIKKVQDVIQNNKDTSYLNKKYWIERGMSEKDATYKVVEIQRERSLRCPEHWINKGMTEEDAIEKVTQYQKVNNKIANNISYEEHRNKSVRCKEYWMLKGMTEEDAIDKVSDVQACGTLDRFIQRYGEIAGKERYDKNIDKMKYIQSLQYFIDMFDGDEEKGIEEYESRKRKQGIYFSKISQELFFSILDELDNTDKIYFNDLNQEYGRMCKRTKKYYFYDFVISDKKKCIEFNGDVFHANPDIYSETDCPNFHYKTLTAKEIWEQDRIKNKVLEDLGYEVFVVWESEYKKDKQCVIDKCLQFINQ